MAVTSKPEVLHFTLGPVQGFVAQARRTRDFWAGSFLLSYLSGHAMVKVLRSGGRLILPAAADDQGRITDPLLAAIDRRLRGEPVSQGPAIATLPNRFQAEVPSGFDPAVCAQEIQRAWEAVAEAIWRRYVGPVAAYGRGTAEIWRRQVGGFWEISWVLGEDPELLDRRKNWRSYVPPVEEGDKCTTMGAWQELSGYVRARERDRQEAFWAALRRQVGGHELEENERLCAIALIKRLLPLVAGEVLWELPQRYPSTPYMAAVPWIKEVVRTNPEGARKFAAQAARLGGYKEDPERIQGIKKELEHRPQAREFAALDANCFFESTLANPRLWGDDPERSEPLRRELTEALRALGPPASPFYALLLMDGDRLGKLLRDYNPGKISAALEAFSTRVPAIIRECDGVPVYAGGDDVLALLPLERAIPAAVALRQAYAQSFSGPEPAETIPATISGAIVYAHFSTPLTAVVREAHRLLDDVAKEETGRDSLAVTVWKGAGRILTWAAPWEVIREGDGHVFDELVEQFSGREVPEGSGGNGAERQARQFTASFFYKLRECVASLGESGVLELSYDQVLDILAAQYIKSGDTRTDREEAGRRVGLLLRVCMKCWRDEKGEIQRRLWPLNVDGALLVKFLAQKGVKA